MAVGFLYFVAPVAALLLVFLPLGGMGLLGLKGGPGIMIYAFIVNSPYGIVTTLVVALFAVGARLNTQRHGHRLRIGLRTTRRIPVKGIRSKKLFRLDHFKPN